SLYETHASVNASFLKLRCFKHLEFPYTPPEKLPGEGALCGTPKTVVFDVRTTIGDPAGRSETYFKVMHPESWQETGQKISLTKAFPVQNSI
ncbi:hypothetical protein, partial [Glutamicibacter ardleyensis]